LRVHRHARDDRDRDDVHGEPAALEPVGTRFHALRRDGRRDRLPLLPDPVDDPGDRARDRRPAQGVARGGADPGRERVAGLVARRPADPRAVAPRRVHPALRQRVLGLRDGVLLDERCSAGRSDHHRQLLHGRLPLEPAFRAGARARDVLRARGDDAAVRAAPAARPAVGAMRARRHVAPSAVLSPLVGAAHFLITPIATLLFSLKNNQTGKSCSLGAYGTIVHDQQFWSTIRLSFILALETIAISLVLFVPTVYWVHLKLPRLRPL